jgi:hypothetical protein
VDDTYPLGGTFTDTTDRLIRGALGEPAIHRIAQPSLHHRSDCGGQLAEAVGVVDVLTADEADARAVLEGEHAPPVVLLIVDPAGAVERLTEGRLHRHERLRQRHGDIVPGRSTSRDRGIWRGGALTRRAERLARNGPGHRATS